MNFLSAPFIIFFLITATGFFLAPKNARGMLLLVASYLFYATWSIPFITIIIATTSFDYWMSKIIAKSKNASTKRTALISGLVLNLLILSVFKYANFFLDNAHSLNQMLRLHLEMPESLNIILPLGISFYTFEAISYMVDVYRGGKPAKSWLEYNFYIMYFPHLISGPIVRFQELVHQYSPAIELPSLERIARGLELMVLGYVFKVIIADQVAPFADSLFATPAKVTVLQTYLGVLGFTTQIYFDFMAYTHIARGASLFFNIELPLNFNHPYHAHNISDFWQRWHISLSRWIRDYLYFPLGGSKLGLSRTVINLLVSMTIAGIWHGAGWPFIVWGGFHGLLIAGYHLFRAGKTAWPQLQSLSTTTIYQLGAQALTFLCVVVGWVFFRASSLENAGTILHKLVKIDRFIKDIGSQLETSELTQLTALAFMLIACFSGPTLVRLYERFWAPLVYWQKIQIACVLLIVCFIMSSENSPNFIYFQF